MRLQTSITLQNTKQWQCKIVIRSLKTFNQCFCEVGQKSAIRDGQNVDPHLAGGGGGVRLLRSPLATGLPAPTQSNRSIILGMYLVKVWTNMILLSPNPLVIMVRKVRIIDIIIKNY